MQSYPLAYLITFTCYGTRLHGADEGSVDRRHNLPGSLFLPPRRDWVITDQNRLKHPKNSLNAAQRGVILRALQRHCEHRGWNLLAAHVRSTHVHFVIAAEQSPERILTEIKAYASRALNRHERNAVRRKRWARHGSTRYLWKQDQIAAAVEYVVYGQGESMAVWHAPPPPKPPSKPRPRGSGGD